MSDMKKWIRLVESVHPVVSIPSIGKDPDRNSTVILGPSVGGGVGRFIEYTAEGSALIDVKGVTREYSSDEYSLPERNMDTGNEWAHVNLISNTPGSSNSSPEFRPGDMVKVADVYGTVIGPGFGVFIGYGTTGEDCIILFDGEKIVVPVENVASVLEQNAKDNFNQMDNDGNLSPMSFGSENVKIDQPQNNGIQSREPAMDQRDEFSKWLGAVEEALKAESGEITGDIISSQNDCRCYSWNCPTCFPDQEMTNPETTTMLSIQGSEDNPQGYTDLDTTGLEEVSMDIGTEDDIDNLMDPPMEEEPQEFSKTSLPRSKDGRGVKLGDIVQKTEYRKVGQDSPLTNGSELEEGNWYNPEMDDLDVETDIDFDADKLGMRDYHNTMAGSPKSEQDVEDAMDMIEEIKYMQSMGLSKADKNYSEDELANMGLPELKKLHSQVTGNIATEGNIMMEKIDKDVAAMLTNLKKYDKLAESVAPVLGMKTLGEKKKPDFLDIDKDGNEEESLSKAKKEKEKEKVEESKDVDPDILEWMNRFSKLGNMKGYGR